MSEDNRRNQETEGEEHPAGSGGSGGIQGGENGDDIAFKSTVEEGVEPKQPGRSGAEAQAEDGPVASGGQGEEEVPEKASADGAEPAPLIRRPLNDTDRKYIAALKKHKMVLSQAAKSIGVQTGRFRDRINQIPELKSLLGVPSLVGITQVEKLSRNSPVVINKEAEVAVDALQKISLDTLTDSLTNAGIDKKVMGRIRGIGGLEATAADILMLGFDLSNRNTIYLQATLMEQADKIRTEYLNNEDVEDVDKRYWQREYKETIDRALKCQATMVQAAVAVARATGGGAGNTSRKKKKGDPKFGSIDDKKRFDDAQ